jgi:hypothetical protein
VKRSRLTSHSTRKMTLGRDLNMKAHPMVSGAGRGFILISP